jgi:hypothetical protein
MGDVGAQSSEKGWITDKDVKFLAPKHEPVSPLRSINAFLSVHGQKEGSAVVMGMRDVGAQSSEKGKESRNS